MNNIKISISRLLRSDNEYYVLEYNDEQFELIDITNDIISDKSKMLFTCLQKVLILNEISYYCIKYNQLGKHFIEFEKVLLFNKSKIQLHKLNYIVSKDTNELMALSLIIKSLQRWLNIYKNGK